MATTRRLPAKLSNLRINAPPADSQLAVIQGESPACSSADDESPETSPSKPRPSRNMKKLSLTLPSSSSLSLQIPTEPQSAVSPTAASRRLRRPSVMSLPPQANPTPNSMLHRKEEDGADATPPYADGPVQIIPGIWLGSEDNARDWKGLLTRGIKSVLNVAKEVANPLDNDQPHLRTVASTPNFNSTSFSRNQIEDTTYVPPIPLSGRPAMHYLKMQWSHGQHDLVQSGFPDAMAFTDAALSRQEGVLVQYVFICC
jgi:tyrosine-protein phosphatase MSG5